MRNCDRLIGGNRLCSRNTRHKYRPFLPFSLLEFVTLAIVFSGFTAVFVTLCCRLWRHRETKNAAQCRPRTAWSLQSAWSGGGHPSGKAGCWGGPAALGLGAPGGGSPQGVCDQLLVAPLPPKVSMSKEGVPRMDKVTVRSMPSGRSLATLAA